MKTIFKFCLTALVALTSFVSQAEYKLPEYKTVKLDNGLTVFLMEQKEVPLINVNFVAKVGALSDGDEAGLAYITAKSLAFGTKKFSKAQIDEAMDFIGANVNSSADIEYSSIRTSFVKKDSKQVMGILRDMVISPRFDSTEFDKFMKRHALSIEQAKESPKSVSWDYFNQLMYGPTGYGTPVNGDEASIKKISLDDVKAFHQRWYQPINSAVIVVGDFDSAKMEKEVRSLFGKWKNTKRVPEVKTNQVIDHKQQNVILVDKADAMETTFLIGGKGITKGNPDRVGVSVINTILGARFTSWLNDELRVNAGLTYGARSSFDTYSQSGTFAISTFTRTETTVEAIDLALKTYQRLWDKGIDEKTLESAKAYVKGQFPPRFETSSQLANLLSNMYGYGYDDNYINTFEQQVNSLTVEKTKQLINQYFPRENLQFVLIGNAQAIKDKVAKYGQIKTVDIKQVGYQVK